ncbi:hypothetical protein C7S17_5795 [Burkholderia thailandensis]|nr:hypothetical protein [Burkholderia thailandensis]
MRSLGPGLFNIGAELNISFERHAACFRHSDFFTQKGQNRSIAS